MRCLSVLPAPEGAWLLEPGRLRRRLTALVLFAAATPAPAATPAGPGTPVADRLAAVLASHRAPERPSAEALVDELVPLGPALLAPAFDVLAERRVPVAGGEPQVLSEPQRDVLLATFEALGRAPVVAAERAWRPGDEELDAVLARMWIRGAVGTAEDVDVLIALAGGTAPTERARVEPPLRHGLTAVLGRDPRALERFARVWKGLRPDLVATALEAVGASRDARGVDALQQILQARPDLVMAVLAQVRLLGPSPSPDVNATLAQSLRQQLDPRQPQRCAAAAIALAVLEDAQSVPTLVGLLESESEGVRQNSAWALGELTGMRFPADAALWRRWLESEEAWAANDKRAAVFRLRSIDPGLVAASIREIARHRLYRDELTRELARLLESRNSNLRRVACAGLQQLGSTRALPLLAAVLDDPDADVARAARSAIATIAGIDAADPEALAAVLARAGS